MYRALLLLLALTPALTLVAACQPDRRTSPDGGTSPSDGCIPEIALLCEGDGSSVSVVARDLCSTASTTVTECSRECARGECVDCAPAAFRACRGDEVWTFDTCATPEMVIETCTAGCSSGTCVDPTCTPRASRTCIGNTVYERDSCGNVGNAVQICDPLVGPCVDGACTGCGADRILCYDGDIWRTDGCLTLLELDEDCPEACVASTASVACSSGRVCTPTSSVVCFEGDLHFTDDCGGVTPEIATDCPSGCTDAGCTACVPVPSGTTCSMGNVHELLGGCPEVAPMPGVLLETCMHGCSEGACLPAGCVPDAGRVCSGGNVHAVDSCGSLGALVEDCAGAGCTSGACSGRDGGTGRDAGTDAGSCTCEDLFGEWASCEMGATSCDGCLALTDGSCADRAACVTACSPHFRCVDGMVFYGATVPIRECSSCVDCAPGACPGCELCIAVCSPPAG